MPPFEGIITGAFIHFKFANGNFGIFSISATKFWFLQQETNRFTFFLRTESISVSFASAKREILTFSRDFVKIPKNTAWKKKNNKKQKILRCLWEEKNESRVIACQRHWSYLTEFFDIRCLSLSKSSYFFSDLINYTRKSKDILSLWLTSCTLSFENVFSILVHCTFVHWQLTSLRETSQSHW